MGQKLSRTRDRKDKLKSQRETRDVGKPERLETQPLKVLILEEHADTRQMLGMFLAALGHRVEMAGICREAMDLAVSTEERFDLLLSDLQLPDGDGWSLLRHLEAVGCGPQQAIALSGWASDD